MRRQRPGGARRVFIEARKRLTQHRLDIGPADPPRPQQGRLRAGQVHDARLHAHLAGPAIQNQRSIRTQIIEHVLRGGRTDLAESIGRRRSHPTAAQRNEAGEQRLRHRMRGASQPDARLTATGPFRRIDSARQDQRQGPWPERAGQLQGPLIELRPLQGLLQIADMHDQRVIGGPPLQRIDLFNRPALRGIRDVLLVLGEANVVRLLEILYEGAAANREDLATLFAAKRMKPLAQAIRARMPWR
jgi:hypothetical protein